MTRIKILDLPRDMKVSEAEMRKVMGGIDTVPLPDMPSLLFRRFSPPSSLASKLSVPPDPFRFR
jgi:hypothetical protein